jgi:hypothetical protein|uniref:Uncharacterized protein n=1 Tax=Eutreptiella gymnastica TaxID=73025 RepID=A0A7S4G556_9EUGL
MELKPTPLKPVVELCGYMGWVKVLRAISCTVLQTLLVTWRDIGLCRRLHGFANAVGYMACVHGTWAIAHGATRFEEEAQRYWKWGRLVGPTQQKCWLRQ